MLHQKQASPKLTTSVVKPVDNSIKCEVDTDCFFNAVLENKQVSVDLSSYYFSVEGIAFNESIYFRFDGYNNDRGNFYGKVTNVMVNGTTPNNTEAYKTVQNIKDQTLGKEMHFTIPVPSAQFFNMMSVSKLNSCHDLLDPQNFNGFIYSLMPPSGTPLQTKLDLDCPAPILTPTPTTLNYKNPGVTWVPNLSPTPTPSL